MKGVVTLFDGSNYLRRKYEEAAGESGMRTCVRDIRTEIGRPNHQCVFVFDGAHANRYRKDIYPEYKNKRLSATDEFYEQVRAFQRIVTHLPLISIRIPEYEADDIIGYLARGFLDKNYSVHIKSTDKDFLQITGATIEGKTFDVPSDQIVLYKVLVGDTSDNIAGVKGFGKKGWEKLDKQQALVWQQSHYDYLLTPKSFTPAVAKWVKENRELIKAMDKVCRFRDVPDELVTKHGIFGKNEPEKVEEILKEYLS